MNLSLNGKTALVCGGSAGIGKAAAIAIAELGASIILCARNEEKLKAVLPELSTSEGQQHEIITVDFSHPDLVKEKIATRASAGTIHIVINNTGGPKGGAIFSADPAAFLKAFEMHIICNQVIAQACVPKMKTAKYGRIINVVSTSVKQPIDNLGVSNTIRGAVSSWAKTMANELGPFGITVNNVLPGFTNTGRLHDIIKNKAEKAGVSTEEMQNKMMNTVPVGRFAEASELGGVIAFLSSPAASYIHGTSILVDGGRTRGL